MADRELCNLTVRLDGEERLEAVFADRELSGRHEFICPGRERVAGAHGVFLSGMKGRGGVVKVQRAE